MRVVIPETAELDRPDAPERLAKGIGAVLCAHGHHDAARRIEKAAGAHEHGGEIHGQSELQDWLSASQAKAAAGLPALVAAAVREACGRAGR